MFTPSTPPISDPQRGVALNCLKLRRASHFFDASEGWGRVFLEANQDLTVASNKRGSSWTRAMAKPWWIPSVLAQWLLSARCSLAFSFTFSLARGDQKA